MNVLYDLLDRHFDGTLDAAGRADLAAQLQQPAARAELVRRARFEALLRRANARPAARRQPRRLLRFVTAACAAAGLLAALGWFLLREEPVPSNEIEVMTGTVAALDGQPMRRFAPGTTVVVEGDQPALLRLPDGSTSHLTPGTSATFHAAEPALRGSIELGIGEGRFDIRTQTEPLAVFTPSGRLTSRAGRFTVQHRDHDGGMAVAVEAGRIEVHSSAGFISLSSGDRREFHALTRPPNPDKPLRRSAVLVSSGGGQVQLRFGKEARGEVSELPVAADARILVDGEPGNLAAIPPGTRVQFIGSPEGGLRELAAWGRSVTGKVTYVDTQTGVVGLELSAEQRQLRLAISTVHTARVQPGMLLRVRLSVDGTRAVSAAAYKPEQEKTRRQYSE